MSEGEIKTIIGACEEISEKNGWTTFAVNVGSQYPVKLSTKVAEVIEQARGAGSEQRAWVFKEVEGKENPNRPGTFYKNRWLNKVGPVDADAQAAASAPPTSSTSSSTPKAEAHHTPLAEPDKQRVISRLSCLSSAAQLSYAFADGDLPDTALEVMKAASRFEQWVYRDIDALPSSGGAETSQPGPDIATDLPADDPPFGGPDDGIPY